MIALVILPQLIKMLINQHVLDHVQLIHISSIAQKENALLHVNIMNIVHHLFAHYVVLQLLVVLHVRVRQNALNANLIKN